MTFGDGTVITNGGEGNFALNAITSRDGAAVNNVVELYRSGFTTWSGGSSFGPHDGPQGDMIEGVNAITYGKSIPSSAHRLTVTNSALAAICKPSLQPIPAFCSRAGTPLR